MIKLAIVGFQKEFLTSLSANTWTDIPAPTLTAGQTARLTRLDIANPSSSGTYGQYRDLDVGTGILGSKWIAYNTFDVLDEEGARGLDYTKIQVRITSGSPSVTVIAYYKITLEI